MKVFPCISTNYKNSVWLSEPTTLAAKHNDVDDLDIKIQSQIPCPLYSFKSINSITNLDEVVNYTIELLNLFDLPEMSPQNLQLNVSSVIIMLRNTNQPKLCNGTRLGVDNVMKNVIEATVIIVQKFKGEDVLISRILLIPIDLPFQFNHVQFPVRLIFEMTIKKSQGQSLEV